MSTFDIITSHYATVATGIKFPHIRYMQAVSQWGIVATYFYDACGFRICSLYCRKFCYTIRELDVKCREGPHVVIIILYVACMVTHAFPACVMHYCCFCTCTLPFLEYIHFSTCRCKSVYSYLLL